MQRTDKSNQAAITLDTSRLTGMQRRMLTRGKAEFVSRTRARQQSLDISFDVVEIHRVASMRPGFRQTATADNAREHGLLLQALQLTNKAQAAFKHAHACLLAI